MKTLLILSSPRKKGSNRYLFDIAKKYFQDADELLVYEGEYKGCKACDYCLSHNGCVKEDDTTLTLKKIASYDRVVMFCPVYFCSFDSKTKALIDRSQFMYANPKKVQGKIALVVTQGSNKEENHIGMDYAMRFFSKGLGKEYVGCLAFSGLDKAGGVQNLSPEKMLVEFLKKLD